MKLAKRNTKVWDYKHNTKRKNNPTTLIRHSATKTADKKNGG
jgi:hypothetical protein